MIGRPTDIPRLSHLSRSDSDNCARPGPADVMQPPPQNVGWSEQGQIKQRFPFNALPGMKVDILYLEDEDEFFQLFFDENLVNVNSSNKSICFAIYGRS